MSDIDCKQNRSFFYKKTPKDGFDCTLFSYLGNLIQL